MRKKILSMSIAAVLTAITSSQVIAFDSIPNTVNNHDAVITTQVSGDLAGYQGNLIPFPVDDSTKWVGNPHPPKEAKYPLYLSTDGSRNAILKPDGYRDISRDGKGRGDALIFPFFNQKDDWGTEIVVRNTTKYHAIVAKVAVYRSSDSLELMDFNVYLSATDVVRFKIENGKLISGDGSIVRDVPSPSSNLNDIDDENFATKENPFIRDVGAANGYVVVYGMAQAKDDTDDVDSHDSRYHNQHARLFANYRRELDVCRPGWRIGHRNAMKNGTYQRKTGFGDSFSVPAPNQAENCTTSKEVKAGNFFGDVGQHLSGTVRLYNGTNAARDMVLPATAIGNFTDENKILWTEGEIANLQDRRIVGHTENDNAVNNFGDVGWALYNEVGIRNDAKAFGVVNTAYTFNEDSVANQLVITQPYKRILVNMGNDDKYWQNASGDTFGTFSYIYNVFNEDEKMNTIAYTHSPYNSGAPVGENEVEIMANLEKGTGFEGENGFALLRFVNGAGYNARLPAIITQMLGSRVAGIPQVNWIYSPTDLFTDKDCPNYSSGRADPNELSVCNR